MGKIDTRNLRNRLTQRAYKRHKYLLMWKPENTLSRATSFNKAVVLFSIVKFATVL